jgi:hypothetical protein
MLNLIGAARAADITNFQLSTEHFTLISRWATREASGFGKLNPN